MIMMNNYTSVRSTDLRLSMLYLYARSVHYIVSSLVNLWLKNLKDLKCSTWTQSTIKCTDSDWCFQEALSPVYRQPDVIYRHGRISIESCHKLAASSEYFSEWCF